MTAGRALVIGGGFAGVAAAARLRALGAAVTLVDERPVLGGRARSDVLEGTTIDTGAQLVAASFARTVRLFDAAALAASVLRPTASRDVLVHNGQRHAIQFGSLGSLLGFGGLGAIEKLKLGASLLPLLARHRGRLDAAAEETPPTLDRESARSYVERHVGPHAADALVEPPVNAACAARGSEISLALYLTMGRYGSESRMLAPAAGWSAALEGALAGVSRELGVRVTALAFPRAGGVHARAADGREWRADVAVVATGAAGAHALLAPHAPATSALADWLARVETRPTWTLAVALDAAADRGAFGVLRHASEARAVIACAVHGAKLGADGSGDGDVVLAWPTPDALDALAGRPAGEIVAAMMPEVEHLVPAVRGHVVRARLYRFDDVPIARSGFVADRARGRALGEDVPLPVVLAGDYLTTPMLEGAVASGERAARVLATRMTAA